MKKQIRLILILVCILIVLLGLDLVLRLIHSGQSDSSDRSEPSDTTVVTDSTEKSDPTEDSTSPIETEPSLPADTSSTDPTLPTVTEPKPSKPVVSVPPNTETVELKLQSIAVVRTPEKTEYFIGDALDITGLVLVGTYSDGFDRVIESGYSYDHITFSELGDYEINVKYLDQNTVFVVSVVPVELKEITVRQYPNKQEYFLGDSVDPAGLTLNAIYSDGSEVELQDGFSCKPVILDTLGTQRIAVEYGGKTACFDVVVNKPDITNLAIHSLPEKLYYQAGDQLDTTGLELLVSYHNGYQTTITSGFAVSPEIFSGEEVQTVTVTIDEASVTFEVFLKHKVVASGVCGDDLNWELTENGVLMISGSGAMYDYASYAGSPWYGKDIRAVVLPKGLTRIGNYSFYWCSGLSAITIPETVEEIGSFAFSLCSGLSSIVIPDSVTSLGKGVFHGASNLSRVYLGKNLRSIGDQPFTSCVNLQGVWVAEGNTHYANDENGALFSMDRSILYVFPKQISGTYQVPEGVTTIYNNAFESCSLLEVIIPDSVTTIKLYAFKNAQLLSVVTIGSGIRTINTDAFGGCISLGEIYIGNSSCVISNSENTLGSKSVTTITAAVDSTAQAYAQKYGFQFMPI